MRVLSISSTLRRHSSARRMPVEYIVISMARWNRLLAESISRIASSRVRMIGSRRGAQGYQHLLDRVHSLQRLAEEEAQRRRVQADRADAEFATPVTGTPDTCGCVLCLIDPADDGSVRTEILHDPQVGVYGSLRVITTLELFQHHFSIGSQGRSRDPQTTTLPRKPSTCAYAWRPPREATVLTA